MVSNIINHLNAFGKLAPKSEYYVANALVKDIGYSVINQEIWKHRKAASVRVYTEPVFDLYGDELDAAEGAKSNREFAEVTGIESLEEFDAFPLFGAYKKLMIEQKSRAAEFPLDTPVLKFHEQLQDMLSKDNTKKIDAAYTEQTNREIAQAIDAKAIARAGNRLMARSAEQNVNIAALVTQTFMDATKEDLSDDLWDTLPLWVRYRMSINLRNSVNDQIARIQKFNAIPDATFDRLLELSNEMGSELHAAARTVEVKLAFKMGRLAEWHELDDTKVEVSQPNKDMKLAHTFTKAPVDVVADRLNNDITGLESTQAATALANDVCDLRENVEAVELAALKASASRAARKAKQAEVVA